MHLRSNDRPVGLGASSWNRRNTCGVGGARGAPQRGEGPPMKVHLPVREAILNRRTYEAPAEGRSEKLRLDFNENTAGCSPAVRRALAKLTTKQLAMYPEYQAPTKRIARYFGVRPEELLLTNGGDQAPRVVFYTFVYSRISILICDPPVPTYLSYVSCC